MKPFHEVKAGIKLDFGSLKAEILICIMTFGDGLDVYHRQSQKKISSDKRERFSPTVDLKQKGSIEANILSGMKRIEDYE